MLIIVLLQAPDVHKREQGDERNKTRHRREEWRGGKNRGKGCYIWTTIPSPHVWSIKSDLLRITDDDGDDQQLLIIIVIFIKTQFVLKFIRKTILLMSFIMKLIYVIAKHSRGRKIFFFFSIVHIFIARVSDDVMARYASPYSYCLFLFENCHGFLERVNTNSSIESNKKWKIRFNNIK